MASETINVCIDKIECELGETITLNSLPDGILCPQENYMVKDVESTDGLNVYANGTLIGTFYLPYETIQFTPSSAGTYTLLFDDWQQKTVEITVTGGDSGVTWTISNKTVKSLTIGNKEVKNIVDLNNGETIYGVFIPPSLQFSQSEYTAINGECSIDCKLNYVFNANQTITLTGTDGSTYTETTDSNGECTFDLIGEGDITYTATYNDLTDSCLVNGMDNKIQIISATQSVTYSTTGCTGTRKKYNLQTIVTLSKTYSKNIEVPISISYAYRNSSSSSYNTTGKLNTTLSSMSISATYNITSSTCTSYQNYTTIPMGTILKCDGNWAFKAKTINKGL